MHKFNPDVLKKLYVPDPSSHKGQNGKVLIIGGSKLFHAASLWPLTIASRLVDMVFYSSIPENNELVQHAKEEFRNGIVVPRSKLDSYIEEAESILIGPGLPRPEGMEEGDEDTKELTEGLLARFPDKKWVIDGGSLQTINPEVLLGLTQIPILTPHPKEFEVLEGRSQNSKVKNAIQNAKIEEGVKVFAEEYHCVVLLKGPVDTVVSPTEIASVPGGNAGMTKGGTGDVLAGLVSSLYCKNDAFLSACAASYINKKAGEEIEKRMGIYFNASDLASEIPVILKELLK